MKNKFISIFLLALVGCAPHGTEDIGRCVAILDNTTNTVGTRFINVEVTKYNAITGKFFVVQPHGIRWVPTKMVHNLECKR